MGGERRLHEAQSPLLLEITDAHALGAKATQGLIVTDAFYWDMNDETRAFSKRFNEKVGHMPTMIQAGLYSATMHYLKAIEAIGTDEALKVMEQMRATPINDFFAHGGKIRIDELKDSSRTLHIDSKVLEKAEAREEATAADEGVQEQPPEDDNGSTETLSPRLSKKDQGIARYR